MIAAWRRGDAKYVGELFRADGRACATSTASAAPSSRPRATSRAPSTVFMESAALGGGDKGAAGAIVRADAVATLKAPSRAPTPAHPFYVRAVHGSRRPASRCSRGLWCVDSRAWQPKQGGSSAQRRAGARQTSGGTKQGGPSARQRVGGVSNKLGLLLVQRYREERAVRGGVAGPERRRQLERRRRRSTRLPSARRRLRSRKRSQPMTAPKSADRRRGSTNLNRGGTRRRRRPARRTSSSRRREADGDLRDSSVKPQRHDVLIAPSKKRFRRQQPRRPRP